MNHDAVDRAVSPPEPRFVPATDRAIEQAMSNAPRPAAAPAPISAPAPQPALPGVFPPYIFGLHERGGEDLMLDAERPGWVLELASVGLDAAGGRSEDYRSLSGRGLGVVVRLHNGYEPAGTLPTPAQYPAFARSCAEFVARARGCHVWIIGNEPNHAAERPAGQFIYPAQYAAAYRLARTAIRAQEGHGDDLVLVAGPAPWNNTTQYAGNPRGDWVQYFVDILAELEDDGCDGFALHTYTHAHDPAMITVDRYFDAPGYGHLRNEFRTYRDYMAAIPTRFRHLPVLITETDPTDPRQGWEPAENLGWVRRAYEEIAAWNADSRNQPIQGLLLYRWPSAQHHGQRQWSIADRPKIVDDIRATFSQTDAERLRAPAPRRLQPQQPADLLPAQRRWLARVTAQAGLRLRLGPSTETADISILEHGTLVEVLAEVGEWVFVNAGRRSGYLFRQYVDWAGSLQPAGPVGELAPPPHARIVPGAGASSSAQTVAESWNRLGGFLLEQSAVLDLPPEVALAVLMAESKGDAFAPDGRMIIRFEPHIFWWQWGQANADTFQQYFSYRPDKRWNEAGQQDWRPAPDAAWRPIHPGGPAGQDTEWAAFDLARQLDGTAAMKSISMGAPQIMGFNFTALGYASVEEMFRAFSGSERAQLESFFGFMQKHNLLDAVRNRDFEAFAAVYNGSGQESIYADRMRAWVKAYEEAVSAAGAPAAAPAPSALSQPFEEVPPVPGALPAPASPQPGIPLQEADEELYNAWREHIVRGYAQNEIMFRRILKGFMNPYWTTVIMYAVLFAVGVAAFVVAVYLALNIDETAKAIGTTALFGGLSVAAFLAFFISRPLQALEENLQFITWLGIVYNTYWTRLTFATNAETFQAELDDATNDAIESIQAMLDKHADHSGKRPGLR